MRRIDPYTLWLGNAGDSRDPARVLDAGIRAIVHLAIEEPPAMVPRDVIMIRVPLLDGAGNLPADLRLAVSVTEQLLAPSENTLICCGAGMSRSPAIAAVAIARTDQITPQAALARLRSYGPTDVSPAFWQELLTCVID